MKIKVHITVTLPPGNKAFHLLIILVNNQDYYIKLQRYIAFFSSGENQTSTQNIATKKQFHMDNMKVKSNNVAIYL